MSVYWHWITITRFHNLHCAVKTFFWLPTIGSILVGGNKMNHNRCGPKLISQFMDSAYDIWSDFITAQCSQIIQIDSFMTIISMMFPLPATPKILSNIFGKNDNWELFNYKLHIELYAIQSNHIFSPSYFRALLQHIEFKCEIRIPWKYLPTTTQQHFV